MADHNADITRTSEGYRRRIRQWQKVRDSLEGEERIKERGTVYLPRPAGMKPTPYTNYVQRASFYAVSERTLRGLCGLVFRVNPVIELPKTLDSLFEFATPEGFTMNQLVREAVQEVLSIGRYGVLVDMSVDPEHGNSPYLATYKAEDIIRWEEKTERARRKLVRVVVREEAETSGTETSRFLRELFIDEGGVYRQRVYAEVVPESTSSSLTVFGGDEASVDDIIAGQFQLVETLTPTKKGQPMNDIPFWFANVFDGRPRAVKPPFLDMVNLNIAHYRNSADYEQSLFMTSQPTPYIFGIPKQDLPKGIGATTIWHSENRDVKAGFIEFTGPGIEALEKALRFKEDRMAAIGARIIMDVERADNVTAETTRLQTRAETSVLVGGVETVKEQFANALRFAAEWAGSDSDDVTVNLNSDFIETRLAPAEITALVMAWQQSAFSRQTLHENLQRGEIIPPDRTMEDEIELQGEEGGGMVNDAVAAFAASQGDAGPTGPSSGNAKGDNADDNAGSSPGRAGVAFAAGGSGTSEAV